MSILALFFFAQESSAFVEQYLFFDNKEINTLNDASLIDGEYYSDQLAFRHTFLNQSQFFNSEEAYDIFVGSLGSKQFTAQQRLKFNKEINENLRFKLAFLDVENFEIARSHLFVGLEYTLNSKFSLAASTSLFSEKSNNDLGFSLSYNINEKHSLKFFYTLPDFSFNERTTTNNENIKSTSNFGILGSVRKNKREFIEYYILKNTPLNRFISDSSQNYVFEELRAGTRGTVSFFRNSLLNLEIEYFNGEEGFFDSSTDSTFTREGMRLLSQVEWSRWIWGVELNLRRWQQTSEKVLHRNIMPHIWYTPTAKNFLRFIDFGLEASFHNASGPSSLRKDSDEDDALESRFNMRINIPFSKDCFLNFLLSLDLDDGSWEGGGGQFQMLF